MKRTAVINVVGLTGALIGEHTPRIRDFAAGRAIVPIIPAFPAVTCTAQSNFLTGRAPSAHGIVGNGWLFRDTMEVRFWQQSNRLISYQHDNHCEGVCATFAYEANKRCLSLATGSLGMPEPRGKPKGERPQTEGE